MKRARVSDTYSTDLRQDQLHAVYKAWYEHSILMMNTQSESPICEDYFTMPLIVLNKSLHTSGIGSKEFNLLDGNETALPSMDETLHKVFLIKNP